MNRKLIFLDIDGTLLPPGEMLIPDSTLQALRAARANGHKLFLCTGRNLHMTAPLLEYGCFDGAICSAGGYVLCDGQVLVDLPMEQETLSALLLEMGPDRPLYVEVSDYCGRDFLMEHLPEDMDLIATLDTRRSCFLSHRDPETVKWLGTMKYEMD